MAYLKILLQYLLGEITENLDQVQRSYLITPKIANFI
jgi:hypothetical protein